MQPKKSKALWINFTLLFVPYHHTCKIRLICDRLLTHRINNITHPSYSSCRIFEFKFMFLLVPCAFRHCLPDFVIDMNINIHDVYGLHASRARRHSSAAWPIVGCRASLFRTEPIADRVLRSHLISARFWPNKSCF